MSQSKSSLRQHFLQIRKSIPESEARIAAIAAADNFLKSINMAGIKTIAFYHPMRDEISPIPLFERLLDTMPRPLWQRAWVRARKLLRPLAGKLKSNRESIIFSLPKITAKDEHLLFYPWQLGEELVNNAIYPQLLESAKGDGHVIPDLIIVPLVVFDNDCNRIGYGGGFYDRTIKELRSKGKGKKDTNPSPFALHPLPLTIGYAYECQKSDTPLPTELHDMQLDFIVTEKCVYSKT